MMMQVVKRNGKKEDVSFDKVLQRIIAVSNGLAVNPALIAQQTLARIYDGVRTSELDDQAALLAFSLYTVHYDYGTLAARIAISNHQRNTEESFSSVVLSLANQVHPITNEKIRYVSEELEAIVREHGAQIDARIDYEKDFLFDYFGFKTLERAYLLKNSHGHVLERPQHMWMRVALGIWGTNLTEAFKTYDMMSQKFMTHATPTLFNSGTPRPQLSSCFLISIEDSINGIYKTLSDCASISKYAGGIGMHIHNIRAKGAIIRGTNGTSNGIVPMLRVFNNTARYVDQCFTPDTLIVTKDNKKIAISDIKAGDVVLTSGGSEVNEEIIGKVFSGPITPTFNTVTTLVTHTYTGPLATLTTDNGSVKVTPSHPFLVLSNNLTDYKTVEQLTLQDTIIDVLSTGTIVYRTIKSIHYEDVDQMTLYDLEIENTHDYLVDGVGIAHNGGGKRNGSFAMYLEPWHADVEDFLKLRLNTGTEEERARDLFYALWIPDLFMERVEADAEWTLFCPSEAPGLADVHGDEFRALYEKYEAEGRGRRKVSAQKLWFKMLDSQIETGTPYLCYKDAANAKSNQKNLGTIKSSNLCVTGDTMILTDKGEIPIKDLAGKDVRVWNGREWSLTVPQQTGADQLVHLVVVREQKYVNAPDKPIDMVSNYRFLECTPYHKFILANGERVEAKTLTEGQELQPWVTPEGHRVESFIYCNGFGDESAERYADTYCFNEDIRHAGIFNGILTGNCTEIIEYSSPEETAVCNLASIALPTFVDQKTRKFNFERLREVTEQTVKNLNAVIDVNYYPTPETRRSNMRHRPIGLGVQGLADVFAMMRLPWEGDAAAELNQRIFEHMYYAALHSSAEIASKDGTYETYDGSPVSKGQLQYDMWENVTPLTEQDNSLNWSELKAYIAANGLRNSLLVAPMPTASTSQILGYNECIEPFTSNIYTRRTLAGEFIIVNRHLMRDLMRYDLWSEDMKQLIIANNGSIQNIPSIPDALKSLYKTSWEIKQRTLIDMAASRGAFICQSQSLNLFVQDPTYAKLTSMHFYSWKKGLKTGIYYLRTKAPVAAQKFTVDPELLAAVKRDKEEQAKAEAEADAGCLHCSA
jgi:ribonucleotide reductase alpha subunit